jgi:multiple sugar transport system substrate-binding protein
MKRLAIGIVTMGLVAAACTAGGNDTTGPAVTVNPSASNAPVTLNVWAFYRERELDRFTDVIGEFQTKYPWITVNIVPGKHFGEIVRGINAGTPIDVAVDIGPDNVGKLCDSGGWIDLNPYMQASGLDFDATFPASVKTYTNYQGKQCALPMLTDAFGLYYNKDLLGAKGYTDPPETLSELTTMAKDLTVFNDDGSIQTIGFDPLSDFYENPNFWLGHAWGGTWYDAEGNSAFGTDPTWIDALQWEKDLIDFYGYDNLVAFKADIGGDNSEWNERHGFEVGRVAMLYDGEWRTAFIQDNGADINYGTAPFPVADDRPDLYGSGLIGGTVVGIPSTAEHVPESWLLVQELTTNTDFLTTLAETIKNVPTTFDALEASSLADDPHFSTFMDIASNPKSSFRPLTTLGVGDANRQASFLADWEAGDVPDPQAGLQDLAEQIDRELQLG